MEKNINQNSINEMSKEVNAAGQGINISGNGKQAQNSADSQNRINMTAMHAAASQCGIKEDGKGGKAAGRQEMDNKTKRELDEFGFTVTSATDIQNREFEEEPCLVQGLITRGLNILSGCRKTGKSWLALYLANQVAGGGDFWGRPTEHGSVLYMALEDNDRRIHERLDTLLEGEAVQGKLAFTYEVWKGKVSPFQGIENYIKCNKDTKLVIIDVLQKIRDSKSDNQTEYEHDYNELGALQRIAQKYGISILVITHDRKVRDNKDWINNICGGVGIPSAADTIMALDVKSDNNEGKDAIVRVTGRDISEKTLKIHFGSENCKWEYVGAIDDVEFTELEDKYKSSPIVNAVKALLDENNGKWSGTSSDLLKEGERVTGRAIAKSEAALGREMNKYDRFFEKDSIQHIKPDSNGGKGGRIHSFTRKEEDIQEHEEYIQQTIDLDVMGNDCCIPDDMGQEGSGPVVTGDEELLNGDDYDYNPNDFMPADEYDDIMYNSNAMPPKYAREEEDELPFT